MLQVKQCSNQVTYKRHIAKLSFDEPRHSCVEYEAGYEVELY